MTTESITWITPFDWNTFGIVTIAVPPFSSFTALLQANSVQVVIGAALPHGKRCRERREQQRLIYERHEHILLRAASCELEGEQSETGIVQLARSSIQVRGVGHRGKRCLHDDGASAVCDRDLGVCCDHDGGVSQTGCARFNITGAR